MERLDAAQLTRFFLRLSDVYGAHCDELCALDAGVGDGDHGLSVAQGFRHAAQAMQAERPETVSTVLACAAEALVAAMTGAIGPVMATFFLDGGLAVLNAQTLGLPELADLFEAGAAGISEFGGAQEGDKTLLDALWPAARALRAAAQQGLPLTDALEKAAAAAVAGAEATRAMAARRGRTRFVAGQGVGHVDPGSVSLSLLVATLRDVARGEGGCHA